MWRLLQGTIPETLRAELETRVGGAMAALRPGGREPENELADFFAASRGAGALLRQLLDQPDARAILGQRLTDPVVARACPVIKQPGAPSTTYRSDAKDWGIDDPAALFTLWFAVTEAGAGNGCLRMGSNVGEGERTMVSVSRLSSLELASTTAPSYDAAMKPGQVLLFDAEQLYGAYPNHSNRPRIAIRVTMAERAALKGKPFQEIGDFGSVGLVAKQGWRKLFGGKD